MQFVGLIRGINVGGHGKLPMKSLLEICAALGFENTRHYIQSGNIVFDAMTQPDPKTLSQAIKTHHGFAPKVMYIPAGDFIEIAAKNPFAPRVSFENYKYLHQFMFTEKPAQPDLAKLETLAASDEQWHLRNNCFDLYSPSGVHNSKLGRDIEKSLEVPTTARNWNTVIKLREMLNSTK